MTRYDAMAALAAFLLAVGGTAHAQSVPETMTVQGVLRDADGAPVSGMTSFTFRLVNGAGDELWTEQWDALLRSGVFTLTLGTRTPISAELFRTNDDVSLEVAIDGRDPLPAIGLGSVPYAFRAQYADVAERYEGDVDWGQLTNVPADFADGTDDVGDPLTAGEGIAIASSVVSVDRATIEGYARNVCFDTESEVTAFLAASDGSPPNMGSARVHWDNLVGVPPGFADGTDDGGLAVVPWSSLTMVPAGFADGVDDVGSSAWADLTGVPAGFADGVDDVGAGDIESVVAGAGLLGGGTSGDVTLSPDFGGTGSSAQVARADHSHMWSELVGVPPGLADGVDDDGVDHSCDGGFVQGGVCVTSYVKLSTANWNTAAVACQAAGADLCSVSQYLALRGAIAVTDPLLPDLFYATRSVWSNSFSDNDAGSLSFALQSHDNPTVSQLYGYACCLDRTPTAIGARGTIINGVLVTYLHSQEDTTFPAAARICHSLRSDLCSASGYVPLNDAGRFSATVRRWTNGMSDNDSDLFDPVLGTNAIDNPAWNQQGAFACCGSQRPLDGSCPSGGSLIGGQCVMRIVDTAMASFFTAARDCASRGADVCTNSQMQILRNSGMFTGPSWTADGADNDGGVAGGLLTTQPDDPNPTSSLMGYACCM
ncbi:MAG: hypothetical protein AB7S26_24340 [Sandaracinaceae bacterium]